MVTTGPNIILLGSPLISAGCIYSYILGVVVTVIQLVPSDETPLHPKSVNAFTRTIINPNMARLISLI